MANGMLNVGFAGCCRQARGGSPTKGLGPTGAWQETSLAAAV
jgi:hypothetical protein